MALSAIKRTIIVFAVAVLVLLALGYFFMPRLIVIAAEQYAGIDIGYAKWTGNPIGKSKILDLNLTIKSLGVLVKADKADLDIDSGASRFFSDKSVKAAFLLEDVSLSVSGISNDQAPGDVLALSFSPGIEYSTVEFKLDYSKNELLIYDFKADSDSVRMSGKCRYYAPKDYIELDLSISVSPTIYEKMPEHVRDAALTPEEDGWYGTVIDVKAPWQLFQFMSALPV